MKSNALSLACIFAIFLAAGPTALAQNGIPRTPSGKPDFNGVWQFPYVPDMTAGDGRNQTGAGELPYTEAGRRNFDNYDPSTGDYTGACLPFGHVRSMNSPNPVQFFQTDTAFAYLFEVNNWHKSFTIDGDLDPYSLPANWYGHANATWDGDTLVVTSTNYNGKTRLDTVGHPHSHELTVIERFTLRDADSLTYEITIDDPIYYSQPWTNTRTFTRMQDGLGLLEYSCNENNKGLWEGRILVPDYENWHTYEVDE